MTDVRFVVVAALAVIMLGLFLPSIANLFAVNTVENTLSYADMPIQAKAVLQDSFGNNTGFIVRFLTSPIASRTVKSATLCFSSSQPFLAGTWFNVSAVTNQTWVSSIANEEQNRTGFTRSNSLNQTLSGVAAGLVCVNVTNQVNAQAALTMGGIEVRNANQSFNYGLVNNFSGLSQDVWMTNTTAATSTDANRTVVSGIYLTVTTTKPMGDVTTIILSIFVLILVFVVLLKIGGRDIF